MLPDREATPALSWFVSRKKIQEESEAGTRPEINSSASKERQEAPAVRFEELAGPGGPLADPGPQNT